MRVEKDTRGYPCLPWHA